MKLLHVRVVLDSAQLATQQFAAAVVVVVVAAAAAQCNYKQAKEFSRLLLWALAKVAVTLVAAAVALVVVVAAALVAVLVTPVVAAATEVSFQLP